MINEGLIIRELVARWLHCLHEAPPMKEGYAIVVDRQAHPRGSSSLCECTHDRVKRLGSNGIVYNPHPFLNFSLLVPRRLHKIAKTGACYACIEFRRGQHANV